MSIKKVEQLLQDNKIGKALELLKDLSMTQEVIKNYELLAAIKQSLELHLSEKWNVAVKQIQDMSCQRFAESILFDKYLNKHFFNEQDIRGFGCSPDYNANPKVEDYKSITEWLSRVYFKKEQNASLDLLHVVDKKTRRAVISLNKSDKEIKDLENSEIKSNELLTSIYYK